MRLKFHGGRGSHPVSTTPTRIQEITKNVWEFGQKGKFKTWTELDAALKKQSHSLSNIFGGNTTCLELNSDLMPMPLFFDAGTGLTSAGTDPKSSLTQAEFMSGKGRVAFFFSHTHWDHIIGLVSLEQIYKGNEFHFYGVHKNLSNRIEALFREENFPVPFHVVEPYFRFHQIPLHTPIQFGGMSIGHAPQTHPGGSFAYRVTDGKKVMVFATDTELKNIDPPHMTPGSNVYSNADVLVLDAQFSPEEITSREGFGHSQIFAAVDFAVREKTKRLFLFHQSPYYSDHDIETQLSRARAYHQEKYGKTHPMQIFMTIEGEEILI